MYCVFFFQAEDGIRDGRVTGVQTCALPISTRRQPWGMPTIEQTSIVGIPQGWRLVGAIKTTERKCAEGALKHSGRRFMRSEERRVGKECRSRRWADQ